MSERSFAEFLAALEQQAATDEEDEAILLAPSPMQAGPAFASASGMEVAPPAATPPDDGEARPRFCRHCGMQLQAHWRFCGRCGRPIV